MAARRVHYYPPTITMVRHTQNLPRVVGPALVPNLADALRVEVARAEETMIVRGPDETDVLLRQRIRDTVLAGALPDLLVRSEALVAQAALLSQSSPDQEMRAHASRTLEHMEQGWMGNPHAPLLRAVLLLHEMLALSLHSYGWSAGALLARCGTLRDVRTPPWEPGARLRALDLEITPDPTAYDRLYAPRQPVAPGARYVDEVMTPIRGPVPLDTVMRDVRVSVEEAVRVARMDCDAQWRCTLSEHPAADDINAVRSAWLVGPRALVRPGLPYWAQDDEERAILRTWPTEMEQEPAPAPPDCGPAPFAGLRQMIADGIRARRPAPPASALQPLLQGAGSGYYAPEDAATRAARFARARTVAAAMLGSRLWAQAERDGYLEAPYPGDDDWLLRIHRTHSVEMIHRDGSCGGFLGGQRHFICVGPATSMPADEAFAQLYLWALHAPQELLAAGNHYSARTASYSIPNAMYEEAPAW